ncbi:cellulose biosynthesis protein BcsG [Paraferrimonas sp. SM1919]|uniref:cellulose biosynthesis protein BcsG n=1 Tax=Paraferrimonas sp. SM1919 TaxID=2662263 RepID=UPI0013D1B922|nr:cellulose biosynthesis protein BcsG [Paraferrimonas sp. SM1919]
MKVNPTLTKFSIGWWTTYFTFKLVLFNLQAIDFSPLYNFGLLCLVAIPSYYYWLNILKQSIAIPLAIALLYYDSYFPPIITLINQWAQVKQMDDSYIMQLLLDSLNWDYLLIVFVIICGYLYLRQILRLSLLLITAMAIVSISRTGLHWQNVASSTQPLTTSTPSHTQPSVVAEQYPANSNFTSEQINNYLSQFFYEQSTLSSPLNQVDKPNLPPNFDILLLNICSISWEDLAHSGNLSHPLLKQFDILFSNFNSATSYSGPAVIRLLRANCGQQPHNDLFQQAYEQCSLFKQLELLGFKSEIFMNHNGEFDGFNKHIANNIGPLSTSVTTADLPAFQYSFDGSLVYDDQVVLDRWLKLEPQSPKVSLYNSISIHDGNRLQSKTDDRALSYRQQQARLLDNLEQFFINLEKSNRNVMVIFVPEHGSAIQANKFQLSGVREVPTKGITHVPVGIKFFGDFQLASRSQITLTQSTSYLAISQIIANVISSELYHNRPTTLELLTANTPTTPHVSQTQSTTIVQLNGRQYYSFDNQSWQMYPENNK